MTQNPSPPPPLNRRRFLSAASAAPVAAVLSAQAIPAHARAANPDYSYEIQQSESEWRAQLSPVEYFVLREGGTEVPHTSLNAFQMDDGHYTCKGCDLVNFDAKWKVAQFEIGWAFFSQARPTTILTSVDHTFNGMTEQPDKAVIECHCRRCASHLGHILTVKGKTLHCLNGISLVFHAA